MLYDAGNSNPVLCDNLEGWEGVDSGRKFQVGGGTSMLMMHSWSYMAVANTIASNTYTPTKNKYFQNI